MKKLLVLTLGIALCSVSAHAAEITSCADAHVGIESILMPPKANSRSFYNGMVAVYNIDTIEPAAASSGLALVLPDSQSETGGFKCVALLRFGHIDIARAESTYDPEQGLTLVIPTDSYNPESGQIEPSSPVTLLINLEHASVTQLAASHASPAAVAGPIMGPAF